VTQVSKLPIEHTEDTQVLRYDKMEHYHAHHDFFDPEDYQNSPHWKSTIMNGARNRLATVFFYLNDVASGGETNFPMAGGGKAPADFSDCTKGISVRPEGNKVILFYSLLPDGAPDYHSLHGGCDVIEGTKWSANYWIWNLPIHFSERRLLPEVWNIQTNAKEKQDL